MFATAALACGPSFQAVYEGSARFEHCYALEENPQSPMPEKASCWREWSEHYTYGQTRDRIHYATARYVALANARDNPTDEALMMAAPGETPRRSTITAPAPTNAFAPPPKVLDPAAAVAPPRPNDLATAPVLDAGAAPLAPPPTSAVLPASSCADRCGTAFRGCYGPCEADAGASSKACQTCAKTYRTCMRNCFK